MSKINLEVNDGELLHIWDGTSGQIMVSYEDTKKLLAFPSIDGAVNFLYLTGHKTAARELNQIKEVTQ